ncbi:odorant receptor 59a-like [Musca domestica]|uniref:Odorant receptor n=1 Tax=Musca domestica TaxID=7370 RepID=A0ABM3V3S3_MUSDO|nr:odorant receptor 59a-like [Musca domestica]
MSETKLHTKSLFWAHFACWPILGMMTPPNVKYKALYWIYSFAVVTILMIGYPLHLILGLVSSSSLKELMQSLSITLTSTVCSIKTMAIWWRLNKVTDMFTIIRRQDERVRSTEEVDYMKNVVYPQVRFVIRLFYVICGFLSLFGELSLVVAGLLGNWRIQYKAYFPFDPYANTKNYVIAHVYQLLGVNFTLVQNIVNDTFASSHLALLRGQVDMLARRVAKIGHDPQKTQRENNQQLLECIRDHEDLLEYRQILEEIISVYMFFQILLCGLNMCVILVYMVIFVRNDVITLSYYSTHLIGVMCEILPSCYYGTLLEDAFQDIAHALFSCNWMDQDLEFKKNLRIFIENSSRRIYVTAWLFRINNNAFIVACKNTYTLFALVMNLK